MDAYLCSLKCESAAPTMCLQWLKSGRERVRLIVGRVVGTRESWFFLNQSEVYPSTHLLGTLGGLSGPQKLCSIWASELNSQHYR